MTLREARWLFFQYVRDYLPYFLCHQGFLLMFIAVHVFIGSSVHGLCGGFVIAIGFYLGLCFYRVSTEGKSYLAAGREYFADQEWPFSENSL